jgi:hypothetical protein
LNMWKSLVAAAAVMLAAGSASAEQKDLLVVVLEEANGHRSVHQQLSPHESCSKFLDEFRRSTREEYPITLTFKAPPAVTGRVLDAYCIHPDGTIETSNLTRLKDFGRPPDLSTKPVIQEKGRRK